MNIQNDMFEQANETTTTTGPRALSGTAQLTNLATTVANRIMSDINDALQVNETRINQHGEKVNSADEARSMLQASKTDHNAMDALILRYAPGYHVTDDDVQFLKDAESTLIDAMLKSQQSKRSRAKNKLMTKENYMVLLTGAIAEHLIRAARNMPKNNSGWRRSGSEIVFDEETLLKLADDQDALRRELRNVQSKKSIAKGKADFDENGQRWQDLLKAEEQLKAIRIAGAGSGSDRTKRLLTELVADIDLEDTKAWTRKTLAERMAQIILLTVTAENDSTDDVDEPTSGEEQSSDDAA